MNHYLENTVKEKSQFTTTRKSLPVRNLSCKKCVGDLIFKNYCVIINDSHGN